MDTQIWYEQLRYTDRIPSGYAQNRIWADSLNEAYGIFMIFNLLYILFNISVLFP